MKKVTPPIEDRNLCTKSPSSIHECKVEGKLVPPTNVKGYSISGAQHLVLLTIGKYNSFSCRNETAKSKLERN